MAPSKPKRTKAADGTVSVAGKNANGLGSVYKATVKRDGVMKVRWEAVHTLPDGRRVKRVASTQAEAKARLAKALAELDAKASWRLGPNPTFGVLVDYYLDQVAAFTVAPTTLDSYRKMGAVVKRIAGDVAVREFHKPAAQNLANMLAEWSDNFARNCRGLASRALNEAIDMKYLTTNPFERVKVAKPADREKRRVLSLDQQIALVAEAIRFEPGDDGGVAEPCYRHGVAVALLFTVGLRVSEVLGLQWTDFDYEAETVLIERSVVYQDNKGPVVRPTKTAATEGLRHLPPFLHGPLQQLREFQDEERRALGSLGDRAGDGFVFVGIGHQLVLRQAVTKELHRVCNAIGLDTAGLATHSGRRTVITNLYVDGAASEDIATAIGHSDAATTRAYLQSFGDRPTDTARRMAALIQPKPKT